jgi:Zn-dependent hydrolases, including glyoxylases
MKIETFVIGMISTNCYLLINEETKEAVVIDPGAAPDYFIQHIKDAGLDLKAILLTHGHFDHILGLPEFLQEFDVPVYAHEEERTLLADANLNASNHYRKSYEYTDAIALKDEEVLQLAGMQFQVIHTPGHTRGGVCYYVEEAKALFSGDTLFLGSVGRADLPTGDEETLKKAIREKLLVLPEDVSVYPGHADSTTIAYEKKHNPYA